MNENWTVFVRAVRSAAAGMSVMSREFVDDILQRMAASGASYSRPWVELISRLAPDDIEATAEDFVLTLNMGRESIEDEVDDALVVLFGLMSRFSKPESKLESKPNAPQSLITITDMLPLEGPQGIIVIRADKTETRLSLGQALSKARAALPPGWVVIMSDMATRVETFNQRQMAEAGWRPIVGSEPNLPP